jgi:hypothetical protein
VAIFICETCQLVLDDVTDHDGSTLRHPPTTPDDHEVVPVPAPVDFQGGKCDFCSKGSPAFVVPANDFRVPHSPMQMSLGDWAACIVCADLIDSGRWPLLVRRAAQHAARNQGRERADTRDLGEVHGLFQALRKNITGPLRRLGLSSE